MIGTNIDRTEQGSAYMYMNTHAWFILSILVPTVNIFGLAEILFDIWMRYIIYFILHRNENIPRNESQDARLMWKYHICALCCCFVVIRGRKKREREKRKALTEDTCVTYSNVCTMLNRKIQSLIMRCVCVCMTNGVIVSKHCRRRWYGAPFPSPWTILKCHSVYLARKCLDSTPLASKSSDYEWHYSDIYSEFLRDSDDGMIFDLSLSLMPHCVCCIRIAAFPSTR